MQWASFHGHTPLWQLAPRWTHLIGDLVRALSPDRRLAPLVWAAGGGIIPLIFGWQRYSNSEAGGDCNLNGPKKRRQNGRPPSLPSLPLLQLYHVAWLRGNSAVRSPRGCRRRRHGTVLRESLRSILLQEARRLIKGSVMRTRKKILSKIDQQRCPYQ